MSGRGAATGWFRRRRWSLGLAILAIVVLAAGYQWLSGGPIGRTVGTCTIVSNPGPRAASDCRGADLAGRDLAGTDLALADLRGADLRGTDLRGAVLYGADLRGTDLRSADLREADLTSVDMTDARLGATRFRGASITSLNVTGTTLAATGTRVWVDDDQPALLSWQSSGQPGIRSDDCAERKGLFYPGANVVTCTLQTDAAFGGSTTYQIPMEVDRAPVIDAPSRVQLTVGEAAAVALHAESPWPAVVAAVDGTLPEGVTWNPATQHLEGVPAADSVGSYTVVFTARNGRSAAQVITIDVGR